MKQILIYLERKKMKMIKYIKNETFNLTNNFDQIMIYIKALTVLVVHLFAISGLQGEQTWIFCSL